MPRESALSGTGVAETEYVFSIVNKSNTPRLSKPLVVVVKDLEIPCIFVFPIDSID